MLCCDIEVGIITEKRVWNITTMFYTKKKFSLLLLCHLNFHLMIKILRIVQSSRLIDPTSLVTFPLGHEIHEVLPVKGWYVAIGHAMQVSRPFFE